MRLKIKHATRYSFEGDVLFGLQQLRKTPKSTHQQTVLSWQTEVAGGKKELSFEDHHNNVVELVSFGKGVGVLELTSSGEIEIEENHGIVGRHLGPAPLWLYENATDMTRAGAGVRALVGQVEGDSDLDRLHGLMSVIRSNVAYEVGASKPDWTAETAVAEGRGVCQDHTHVFLAAAREMGFPARYVSGYLMLNDRVAQEAMHAWAEAHVESIGWVGFDVSNGISPDTRYVRVATGLDYQEAAPVTGTRIGGTGEALDVRIEVAEQ